MMMKRALVQVLALTTAVVAVPAAALAAPAGNPASYTLNRGVDENHGQSGVVVRWNPCRRLSVRINPGPYGAAGVAEGRQAVTLLARATGLQLFYAGTTRWFPTQPYAPGQRSATGTDLVLGFADPRRTTYFGRGFGQGSFRTVHGPGVALQISDGTAFVAADPRLSPGFRPDGHSRGMLLLHELGHAVGLGHVSDRAQVMAPLPKGTSPEYQRGDLAGLRRVGRPAGCITTRPPAPRPAPSPTPSPVPPATSTATTATRT